MAFEGNTGVIGLEEILSLCLAKTQSGAVRIRVANGDFYLSFQSGKLTGIDNKLGSKSVPDVLLQKKVITPEQLRMAQLNAQSPSLQEESLISMEIATGEQIQIARYYLSEMLFFDLLSFTEGSFEFIEDLSDKLFLFDITFRDWIAEVLPDCAKLMKYHLLFPDLDTRFFWISPQDFAGLPEQLSLLEMKLLSRYRPNISVRGYWYSFIESRQQIVENLELLVQRGVITTEVAKIKPPDSRPFLRALLGAVIDRLESVQKQIGVEGEITGLLEKIAGILEESTPLVTTGTIKKEDNNIDDLASITSSMEGLLNLENLDELSMDAPPEDQFEQPDEKAAEILSEDAAEANDSADIGASEDGEDMESADSEEEYESLEDRIFTKVRYRRFVSNVTMGYNRLQLKKMNYFEMLNIPPNADKKTIHRAFIRAIRKINPKGIVLQERDKVFLEKAIFIRDKLKAAYQTLTEPALRKKYLFTLRENRESEEKKKSEALILFNRGMVEIKNGNFDKAREIFKQAITLDPRSPVYYNMLESIEKEEASINASKFFQAGVLAFTQKHDIDRAVKLIKKAIILAPSQVLFHQKLADILSTRSEFKPDAIQNYEIALELDPGNIELRLVYSNFLKNAGMKQEAANKFQEVLKWSPDNPVARKELLALKKEGVTPKKSTEKVVKQEEDDVEI